MTGFALSPAARADLEAIWDYTVERWSRDQAERYILAIGDACESLGSGKGAADRPKTSGRATGGFRSVPMSSSIERAQTG